MKRAVLICIVMLYICCVAAGCRPRVDLNVTYSYTDEERVQPFWTGNVMRNETVMVVKENGVTQGKLLYPALKVLAVYDSALKHKYEPDTDYVVQGDTITLPQGSAIPVFNAEWNLGQNIPNEYPFGDPKEGYSILCGVLHTETQLIHGNYINVSYVYDSGKIDKKSFPTYTAELSQLSQMVSTQDTVKVAVYGDSISVGYSSSSSLNRPPYQPSYGQLVADEMQNRSSAQIQLKNFSLGGANSYWGAQNPQLGQLTDYAPDVCLIAFGTNDEADGVRGDLFFNNIVSIIDALRQANERCQIIVVAPFPSNFAYKSEQTQQECTNKLRQVGELNYKDVVCVDLYAPCVKMLAKKHYYELSASNINHPNDFVHRLYAMCILSVMFDYQANV